MLHRPSRVPASWLPLALLVMLALPPGLSQATNLGSWARVSNTNTTSTAFMNGTGVNLTIVPRDSAGIAGRSMVLWYADDEDDQTAVAGQVHSGAWLWTPPADAATNAGTWPESNFQPFGAIDFGYRTFCSGMAPMFSGSDVYISGGTTELEDGSDTSGVFRSLARQTTLTKMQKARWYSDALRLPGGRELVTGGSRYKEIRSFGGSAADTESVGRCPIGHVAAWDTPVVPFASGGRPSTIEGHSATIGLGGEVFFGGKNARGYLNDLFILYANGNREGPDYEYVWSKRAAVGSTQGSNLPYGVAYHAAATFSAEASMRLGVTNGTPCFVIFGGLGPQSILPNAPAVVNSSVWWCSIDPGSGSAVWHLVHNQVGQTTDIPGARSGHVGIWDSGLRRLFVFGGASSLTNTTTTLADNNVYSMSFAGPDSVIWQKCTATNTPPSSRMSMASDLILPAGAPLRRIVLYGGRTSSTTLSSELYVLETADVDKVTWHKIDRPASGFGPPALELVAGAAPTNAEQMWISGGKITDGTPQDGVWSANVAGNFDTLTAHWEQRLSNPRPVFGHTFRYLDSDIFERTFEVYNPVTGTHTLVKDANNTSKNLTLLQDWYTHGFVLPGVTNGKWNVFLAGPGDTTYVMTIDTTAAPKASLSMVASFSDTALRGFRGGSTVMYRPGKFLKCGGRDTDYYDVANLSTPPRGMAATLDVSNMQWVLIDSLTHRRVDHNMTILADGKVLVTGGLKIYGNDRTTNADTTAEIWDPERSAHSQWGDVAPNPFLRGYHSSTILTLDARVLSTGGNYTDRTVDVNQRFYKHQWYADLYSPPYLFNSSGGTATRPVINTLQRTATYGADVVVSFVGNATIIARMALLAPGAATHGFDESQRYLPLTFSAQSDSGAPASGQKLLHVTMPVDSVLAPLGDYMFFAMDGAGVPCVAHWLRLGVAQPQKIAGLAVDCPLQTLLSLKWTAPAMDWHFQPAPHVNAYELRGAKNAAVDTTAAGSGQDIDSVTPSAPEQTDFVVVTSVQGAALTTTDTYRFRIRARDDSGVWSVWSATISVKPKTNVDCLGTLAGGGGGGGGGARAERTSVIAQQPGAMPGGNSMLDGDPALQPSVDAMVLPSAPAIVDGHSRLWLAQSGGMVTHVGDATLVTVDHATGAVVVPIDSAIVAGARVTARALTLLHEDGTTDTMDPSRPVTASAGDMLRVDLASGGEAANAALALSGRSSYDFWGADSSGVLFQVPEGASGWRTLARRGLRHHSADVGIRNPGSATMRLVFLSTCTIDWVGHLDTSGGEAIVTRLTPVAATQSDSGDVLTRMGASGVDVAGGESFAAFFDPAATPSGLERSWIFELRGWRSGSGGSAQASRIQQESVHEPVVFGLGQNHPNPFAHSTQIRMGIPNRSAVKLEVFDLFGRRIRVLADKAFEPGYYSLEWDGRSDVGARSAPGVYMYRLSASGRQLTRRLILLP